MKATLIVHWPGRDVPACQSHAARLSYLAWVLSFQLSSTPADGTEECTNCERESEKLHPFGDLGVATIYRREPS